ncbi:MAG: hypothetical protein JMM79_01255 [Candidatus Xiphinematobacter sp.]|nr:MAG: hypothetical protein JMM79_01255 [Candidatus Xiphinematobacter sp.]
MLLHLDNSPSPAEALDVSLYIHPIYVLMRTVKRGAFYHHILCVWPVERITLFENPTEEGRF